MMVRKIVWWVLTVACLFMIFGFSSQSAAESSQVSGSLTETLLSLFPSYNALSFEGQKAVLSVAQELVRSAAHVATFAALGFCVYMLTRSYDLRFSFLVAYPSCVLVAVADECLQRALAAGRAFEWVDLLKDWSGSLLGIGVAVLVGFIIKGIYYSRKEA